jgi:hypothetical protein
MNDQLKHAVSRGLGWIWAGGADLRAALVGALVSLIGAYAWGWYLREPPPMALEVYTNAGGYANPMPTLLERVKADELKSTFSFDPPAFKDVWVCEYSLIHGRTGREIMLAYINKYSMCFSLVQKSELDYIIRPKPLASSELRKTKDGWLCRCDG